MMMMKVFSYDSGSPNPEVIQEAIAVLKNGGVIAHPTDTCYGLATDINNEKALKKLYNTKQMPLDKPVSILVRSLEEALKYGEFCDLAVRMAGEFWPGPLTLVVPRKDNLSKTLNSNADYIGLRVIDEPVSVALLEAMNSPLSTTSANLHGQPTPFSVSEITAEPDLVIDVGDLKEHHKPSTVIHVEKGRATTLRQGDLFDLYAGLL